MKLVRFVLIHYPVLSEKWDTWIFHVNDVEVSTMHTKKDEIKTVFNVCGVKTLKYKPKLTGDKYLIVPAEDREIIEEAIVHINNLISIEHNYNGRIFSLSPCVAFYPESRDEENYLNQSEGVLRNPPHNLPVRGSLGIDIDFMMKYVTDRMDGVTLISESISHNSGSGKFHEYIRFFERAFKLSARKLINPLNDFLSTTKFGYKKEEIKNWIDIRDPLTHADQRNYFYIHSDIYLYLNRMEQAVYDVLFNKLNWRSNDTARRNIWKPLSGSSGPNSNIFLTRGKESKLQFEVRDEFGVFSSSLKSMKELPIGCWYKPGKQLVD